MKNSSVSARIPSEIARRLDLIGINVSSIINEALFKASMDTEIIEKEIKETENRLGILKSNLNKIKEEKKKIENNLIPFLKESRDIIRTDSTVISARIKYLYNEFKIATDEAGFYRLMEEYLDGRN